MDREGKRGGGVGEGETVQDEGFADCQAGGGGVSFGGKGVRKERRGRRDGGGGGDVLPSPWKSGWTTNSDCRASRRKQNRSV